MGGRWIINWLQIFPFFKNEIKIRFLSFLKKIKNLSKISMEDQNDFSKTHLTQTRASFPLFQMLYNSILTEEEENISSSSGDRKDISTIPTTSTIPSISTPDKNHLCKIIKDLDDYHMELVFALIRCYHLQVDQGSIFETPYSMKKVRNSNNYRFEVENIPPPLLKILLKFIHLHHESKHQEINYE